MTNQHNIWQTIESKIEQYNSLGLETMKDYNKFYLYSIIAHSTAIEGSTLSEKDAVLLFDEGLTGGKKPIAEYLMNLDLKLAYEFAAQAACAKTKISPEFLKTLNVHVMKNTGSINNVAVGTFNSSCGDYRLCGVTAGIGGESYMNYQKIPGKVIELCNEINKRLDGATNLQDAYNLSFDAHFNLLTIHPWLDGNGRTGRLLMNYIQMYHGLHLTKIYRNDKADYISALVKSREDESNAPIHYFMAKQHLKTIKTEIDNHQKEKHKNEGFSFLF